MITLFGRVRKLDNYVVSIENASPEWVEQWNNDNPDADEIYYYGWEEDTPRRACIGGTWDQATTWFIPPSPGDDFTFDRWKWEWVPNDTPTE